MAVAATDALEATEDESQFRIEATGALREPRTRILKHGETFGVLNQFGDMVGEPGSPDGLYHQDTRFLSQLELRLNGDRPLLLSSNPAEDGSVLPVDLANTDTTAADGSELHRELIYVNRRQFIWRSAYYELLQIRNFDLRRHQVTLSVRFGADFADVFEVRGLKRERRGKRSAERLSPDAVVLRYAGLDGIDRTTTLDFAPAPAQLDRSSAEFVLDLGPGQGCRLALRAGCGDRGSEDWTVGRCYRALRDARRALQASSGRAAAIEGSNAVFNELARRSIADLYMLNTETDKGPYPFAGIPWYSAVFGRDGIITALTMCQKRLSVNARPARSITGPPLSRRHGGAPDAPRASP